jgi:hypothetical protein
MDSSSASPLRPACGRRGGASANQVSSHAPSVALASALALYQ